MSAGRRPISASEPRRLERGGLLAHARRLGGASGCRRRTPGSVRAHRDRSRAPASPGARRARRGRQGRVRRIQHVGEADRDGPRVVAAAERRRPEDVVAPAPDVTPDGAAPSRVALVADGVFGAHAGTHEGVAEGLVLGEHDPEQRGARERGDEKGDANGADGLRLGRDGGARGHPSSGPEGAPVPETGARRPERRRRRGRAGLA